MTETKEFPADVVLTIVTGHMICDQIGQVYEILNWMTDDEIYTHQIPRVIREVRGEIVKMHPRLAQATPMEGIEGEPFAIWVRNWITKHGYTYIKVPKVSHLHVRKDPVAELQERFPNANIIVVHPPKKE